MTTTDQYWYAYFDPQTIGRSDALRQDYFVETSGVRLHVEAYLQSDPNAAMVLLNHGEGGYSRMLVGVAMALHASGCSVLVADQRGHGFSSGRGVDFTLPNLVQDVLDAAHWARRSFSGPLFLGGIHGGSGLAYAAAALGAPVVGLICHHLYDFTDPGFVLSISRFAGLGSLPGGANLATGLARALMAVSPRMRLPIDRLAHFNGMLDERDNGRYEAWLADPFPARIVSPRYAVSTLSTPPAVPLGENALPVLVINPLRDRMVDPGLTRAAYERLAGPKTYAEIDAGHWSMMPEFSQEWAAIAGAWIEGILARPLE